MNIDELKQRIEQETGIPASLLNNETSEEIIAKAKALLAYRREMAAQKPQAPKSTKEQFADWLHEQTGEGEVVQDSASAALAQIENELRVVPVLRDAGEAPHNTDGRSNRELFAQYIYNKTSWNPRKYPDSWQPLQ